jgi:hypothetical protein
VACYNPLSEQSGGKIEWELQTRRGFSSSVFRFELTNANHTRYRSILSYVLLFGFLFILQLLHKHFHLANRIVGRSQSPRTLKHEVSSPA